MSSSGLLPKIRPAWSQSPLIWVLLTISLFGALLVIFATVKFFGELRDKQRQVTDDRTAIERSFSDGNIRNCSMLRMTNFLSDEIVVSTVHFLTGMRGIMTRNMNNAEFIFHPVGQGDPFFRRITRVVPPNDPQYPKDIGELCLSGRLTQPRE